MAEISSVLFSVTEVARDLVFGVVLLLATGVLAREGVQGILLWITGALKSLPGVTWLISRVLRGQVRGFLKQVDAASFAGSASKTLAIPEEGELACVVL